MCHRTQFVEIDELSVSTRYAGGCQEIMNGDSEFTTVAIDDRLPGGQECALLKKKWWGKNTVK